MGDLYDRNEPQYIIRITARSPADYQEPQLEASIDSSYHIYNACEDRDITSTIGIDDITYFIGSGPYEVPEPTVEKVDMYCLRFHQDNSGFSIELVAVNDDGTEAALNSDQ